MALLYGVGFIKRQILIHMDQRAAQLGVRAARPERAHVAGRGGGSGSRVGASAACAGRADVVGRVPQLAVLAVGGASVGCGRRVRACGAVAAAGSVGCGSAHVARGERFCPRVRVAAA